MGSHGPGAGSRLAIGASIALMVAGLAGVPMYVSSTGTAALAIQVDEACRSDLGLRLGTADAEAGRRIAGRLEGIDHLLPLRELRRSNVTYGASVDGDGLVRRAVLLAQPGQFEQLERDVVVPSGDQVVVPEWITTQGGYLPGTPIDVVAGPRPGDAPAPVRLDVVDTYPDIPTRPEPEFWCSFRDDLRLSAAGDRRPPVMLVPAAAFDTIPADRWFSVWEIAPDPDGLRVDQATRLVDDLQTVLDAEWALDDRPANDKPPIPLATSIRRSEQVADFVAASIAPLRWAAVVAALVLLVAAGMMAARSRRRELRIRVLRGVSGTSIALGQLGWLIPTGVAGAVVGFASSWFGVRTLGPSPYIEPSSVTAGAIAAGVGLVGSVGVLAGVMGVVASSMVDRRTRVRVPIGPVAAVAVVGAAIWSFVRLDRFGGVRQIGVEVRGGDLLAQAFPLLGAVAVIVLLVAPAIAAITLLRRIGRRWPAAALIGVRRIALEPRITAAVTMSTALVVAVAFQASALTRSVDRLLSDKASMFVGADLTVQVLEPPDSMDGLGSAATQVLRTRTDDRTAAVMGVDPATFADVATWRSDGLDIGLGDAVSRLVRPGAADGVGGTAIVVDPGHLIEAGGPLAGDLVTVSIRDTIRTLRVVARPRFFPGDSNVRPTIVVDDSLLDDRGDRAIWVRAPIPDAVDAIRSRGARVVGSVTPDEIFDGTNFLSAKWAYDTLTAFAVVLAFVTVLGQVLIVEARQRLRRAARVLARPMGVRARDDVVAGMIEIGVPLTVGTLTGTAVGWSTARLALPRLDSLRTRQPPALLVTSPAVLVAALGAIAVVTTVLAVWSTIRSSSDDPDEVMRVSES